MTVKEVVFNALRTYPRLKELVEKDGVLKSELAGLAADLLRERDQCELMKFELEEYKKIEPLARKLGKQIADNLEHMEKEELAEIHRDGCLIRFQLTLPDLTSLSHFYGEMLAASMEKALASKEERTPVLPGKHANKITQVDISMMEAFKKLKDAQVAGMPRDLGAWPEERRSWIGGSVKPSVTGGPMGGIWGGKTNILTTAGAAPPPTSFISSEGQSNMNWSMAKMAKVAGFDL